MWFLEMPSGNFNSWFNRKDDFIEKFVPPNLVQFNREIICTFKQEEDTILIDAWERYREIINARQHGLGDLMILYSFVVV
jgi:hypothetical protein